MGDRRSNPAPAPASKVIRAMRGKIDLQAHPAARKRVSSGAARKHPQKKPNAVYAQLWRIVEGGVRDLMHHHPDYFTTRGKAHLQDGLTKRVVGELHGYVTQVAKRR